MPVDLHIPYALKNGRVVHVDAVARGLACGCVCPSCGERLVAHKGEVQAHHFQHQANATACESPLHATAKWLLYERVNAAITNREPLPVRWQCHRCPCTHYGDLIDGVNMVWEPETPIPGAQVLPDLWLSMVGLVPCAFIEIVVTHEPEEATRQYARANTIPIWEFHLWNTEDLERLRVTPLIPHAVQVPYCLCGLCPGCNRRPCMQDMRDHEYCARCGTCYHKSPRWIHYHCDGCGDLINGYGAAQGYTKCNDCIQGES